MLVACGVTLITITGRGSRWWEHLRSRTRLNSKEIPTVVLWKSNYVDEGNHTNLDSLTYLVPIPVSVIKKTLFKCHHATSRFIHHRCYQYHTRTSARMSLLLNLVHQAYTTTQFLIMVCIFRSNNDY